MVLKRLATQLRNKLEYDLSIIGGELLEFDPEQHLIEVEVVPDTAELRSYAALLIKDALAEYYIRKDKYLRSCNPLCGVEKLIESNIVVDDLN